MGRNIGDRHASLLAVTAVGAAGLLLITGFVVRDVEAIVIGVGLVGTTALLRFRNGGLGRAAVALLLADTIFWMLPAAWSNATHDGPLLALAVPLALVALSATGIAAAARLPDRFVGFAALGLSVVALGVVVVSSTRSAVSTPAGALVISSRGAQFSTAALSADRGEVAVVFRNHDLFWHTFTIDALDVDSRAPLSSVRLARFRAEPGIYAFYCAIPGHKAAGMEGTLTIR